MARALFMGSEAAHGTRVLFVAAVAIVANPSWVFAVGPLDPTIAKLEDAGISVRGDGDKGFSVAIRGDLPITDKVWTSLEAIHNIKSFWIAHKDVGPNELKRISKIESVETFEMWGYRGKQFSVDNIGDVAILAQLPNLRSIRIIHSSIPGDQGAKLLAFKNHPKLTSLALNTAASDEAMKAVGELTQLKEFSLFHCQVSPTGFANLARLNSLERLRLGPAFNALITGSEFKHLSGLRNLRELTIEEMVLPYEGGLEYLKGLGLKTLLLRKCIIAEADLSKLKADLPETKIEQVDFYDDEVKRWHDALARKKSR